MNDALPKVYDMVERMVELGWPAAALCDHGNMHGAAQLYKAGKKLGVPTLPGVEMYLPRFEDPTDRKNMHLTVLSYTSVGYRNVVALNNLAHANFYYRPRISMAQFAAAAEDGRTDGVAVGTGCRSGPVVQALLERGPDAARQVARALSAWFPRVYVEVMDHQFSADGISDAEITAELYAIAQDLGLPMVLSSDSHFLRPEDVTDHTALKQLIAWTPTPEDAGFSGQGYWLPTWADMTHIPAHILDACEEGQRELANVAKVLIPELDVFSLKVPDVTLKNEEHLALTQRFTEGIERILVDDEVPAKKHEAYRQRGRDEAQVACDTGMAGYLLLTMLICDFMRREGIWYQTRGSAAGSLGLYACKVTQYDPIVWDIRMDRFLSGDRTSPPDVDLDIEHTRRGEVIAFLEELGYEVRQVGTQAVYGLGFKDERDEEEKGSLRQAYFSAVKKMGLTVHSWGDIPPEHKAALFRLADLELLGGIGAHPGGHIVSPDAYTVGCLPMVKIASSDTMVTAFDKNEIEEFGFPKIDLLGSRVLTAVRHCCEFEKGPGHAAYQWFVSLPLDDKATLKRITDGKTTGLFQLGGTTNRRGFEDMKPKKTVDIVAGQALFRPAPLKSGFTKTYMDRRRKVEPIPPMHADIAAETRDTYGVALYQEQVVGLMRRIGMKPAQLTRLLKAVKASGKAGEAKARATVAEELPSVRALAESRGWEERDVDYLADCLVDYGAGYSFGKGHSVTYGVAGYFTAYLAEHVPLAYWYGMLHAYQGVKNSRGDDLEPMYITAARKDGVHVLDPNVNRSGTSYTPDREHHAILRGLASIKGVGPVAAHKIVAKQPYASLVEFGQKLMGEVSGAKELVVGRAPADCVGVVAALAGHRALSHLPDGVPVVRVTSRSRKCVMCVETFQTPTLLQEHLAQYHPTLELST